MNDRPIGSMTYSEWTTKYMVSLVDEFYASPWDGEGDDAAEDAAFDLYCEEQWQIQIEKENQIVEEACQTNTSNAAMNASQR